MREAFMVCRIFRPRVTECHIYAITQSSLNNFHLCYNHDFASRKLADVPYSEKCALCYNCDCIMLAQEVPRVWG